jgi:hypothetical protein
MTATANPIFGHIAECKTLLEGFYNDALAKLAAIERNAIMGEAAFELSRIGGGRFRPGTKEAIVYHFLTRPEGTTSREVREAVGWPTISIPWHVSKFNLTMTTRQVNENGRQVTRYFCRPRA